MCSRACPAKAIEKEELSYPRSIRRDFSDPVTMHRTMIHGRGTEEMKTNDVTGRFKVGELGFSVEFGRPSFSTSFEDIEKFTTEIAKIGVEFEENNPMSDLISDDGELLDHRIRAERVLSTVVEFRTKLGDLNKVLDVIRRIEKSVNTAFCVGVIFREEDREGVLKSLGTRQLNGKINLGLGR